VPFNDVKAAFEVHQPQLLLTSITSPLTRNSLENYIERLATNFPHCEILLTGWQIHSHQPKHPNIKVLKSVTELDQYLSDPQ
jgi:MerR family transcriptional regulator, light-induced transcriptional regulator